MKSEAIEWYDHYEHNRERTVYTNEQSGIPGLRVFAYESTSRATASLQLHYHPDCFEFCYVVQGSLWFFAKGKKNSISGGDMFFTYPNEEHSTGDLPMNLHQMYWFQLDVSDPDNFLFLKPEAAKALIRNLMSLTNRVVSMEKDTGILLADILSNIAAGTELGRFLASTSVCYVLGTILKRDQAPVYRLTPDIGKAVEYILDNIQDDLELEELARISLLSVSRFKQKFTTQIGTSPRSFINFYKIEAAKEMLDSGMSVTDTAMELNFSSSNYFSAVFRRYTSCSPTEYREQAQQKQQK